MAKTYASSLKTTAIMQAMNNSTGPVNPLGECTITYTLEIEENAIQGEAEYIRHTQVFDAIRKASGWLPCKLNGSIHTLQILSKETVHIVFHKPEEVDPFFNKCPMLAIAGRQYIGSKPGSNNIYEKRPRSIRVKLHEVPITLSNDQILQVLSKYGTLPKRPVVFRDMYEPPYNNIATGSRTLYMEKINNKAGLPPSILIEDYPIRVYHPNQIRKYSERKKIHNEDDETLEEPTQNNYVQSNDKNKETADSNQQPTDVSGDIQTQTKDESSNVNNDWITVRSPKKKRRNENSKMIPQAQAQAPTDSSENEEDIIQSGDTLIPAPLTLDIDTLSNETYNDETDENETFSNSDSFRVHRDRRTASTTSDDGSDEDTNTNRSTKRRYSVEFDKNNSDQDSKKVDKKLTPTKTYNH
jgi:hypothetical protein